MWRRIGEMGVLKEIVFVLWILDRAFV